MDLIDREQLKATIRKMVEIPNETRAQVIGAISRAKAVDGWIPVTERLPREEWERYCAESDWDVYPCLVTIKNNRGERYVTKLFFTGENFVNDEYVRYTAQVTHWMPLPQAPKGE